MVLLSVTIMSEMVAGSGIANHVAALATLSAVWAMAVISPGPNFLATVHQAAAGSRGHGVAVALGVATGTLIWVTSSVFGLGLVFTRIPWLVDVIRWVGGAYLVYLGLRLLIGARRPVRHSMGMGAPEGPPSPSRARAFRIGLLTNLGNPKTAAFFASLFVVMMPADPPLAVQAAVILLIVGLSATWYSLVAWLFSTGPTVRLFARGKRTIDALCGGLYIALGAHLAWAR